MGKPLSLVLLTLLLATTIPPPSQASSEYCTIQDLQQQTVEGWHQRYETTYRTVQIDAEIVVPQVDALPIVRFQNHSIPYPVKEEYASIDTPPYGFFMTYDSPTLTDEHGRYTEEHKPGTFDQELYHRHPWDLTKAYAANNPFTLQEAIDFLDDLFLGVTEGAVHPYVSHVKTAQWVEKKRNPDGSANPYLDMGFYSLKINQAFHGIPLLGSVKVKKFPKVWKPSSFAEGFFWAASREKFRLDFLYPQDELDVLVADVPVLPLEKIIPVYEKLIMDGYVRDVASLDFGYATFWETKEHTTMIAYPCWFLISEFSDRPNQDRAKFFAEKENNTGNPVLGVQYDVVVNAQTGELFDPFSISQEDTYCPKIITWDDVGGRP